MIIVVLVIGGVICGCVTYRTFMSPVEGSKEIYYIIGFMGICLVYLVSFFTGDIIEQWDSGYGRNGRLLRILFPGFFSGGITFYALWKIALLRKKM